MRLENWLMENADSVIRYRIANEFIKDGNNCDLKDLQQKMLENTEVQLWLENLRLKIPSQDRRHDMVHGSFDFSFENAMLKALQLGLHAGIPQLDDALQFYFRYLQNEAANTDKKRTLFYSNIIASMLLKAGYRTELVVSYMKGSLDELYSFTRLKNYDIYVENRSEFKGLPTIWKNKPIIKPEIFVRFGFGYPMIYDMIGLSAMYQLGDTDINEKIENVVDYIVNDEFHDKIADGYGIIPEPEDRAPGRAKYHGMGWDPKLPGYYNMDEYVKTNPARLLFFADIMCDYPGVVKSRWYNDAITIFEQFKTSNGTYCFPKEFLREKGGYAVQGFHLGLGENRRKKLWCEIESTFRMVRLKSKL